MEQEPLPLALSNPCFDSDAPGTSATIESPLSTWEQTLRQREFGNSFFFDFLPFSSMTVTQTFNALSFILHLYDNTVLFFAQTLSNQVSEDFFLIFSQASFTFLDTEKTFMKILGKEERFVHPRENLLSEVSKTQYYKDLPLQIFVTGKTQFKWLIDVMLKVILHSHKALSQNLNYQQLSSEMSQSGVLLDRQQMAIGRDPSDNVDATLPVAATDFGLSIQLFFDEVKW